MPKSGITSPRLAPTRGIFGHGTRAGNMVFVSGQVAFNNQKQIVGVGDVKAQTRQVMENIKAVLDEAGATFDDVVKVTAFITDMGHFPQIHEVRAEYFKEPYPASTMVEVRALATPDLLIEIDAIAVVS